VRTFVLVVGAIGVGGLVLGWILGRLGVVRGGVVSFSGGVLLRLLACLVIAWTAVTAAAHDELWLRLLAVPLGLLALGTLMLEGFRVWAALKYGVSED